MTVKREAELETEVRMLREQVAGLERVIAGMQPVFRIDPARLTQGCAPYPYLQYWYPNTWTVTSGNFSVIADSLSEASTSASL